MRPIGIIKMGVTCKARNADVLYTLRSREEKEPPVVVMRYDQTDNTPGEEILQVGGGRTGREPTQS